MAVAVLWRGLFVVPTLRLAVGGLNGPTRDLTGARRRSAADVHGHQWLVGRSHCDLPTPHPCGRLLVPATDIRYRRGVQYEWDNDKAADNLGKHGVDFFDAIAALEDPNRLEEIDTRFVYGEERVRIIGMARGDILLVIVTVRDEDVLRIISARKATRHEQDR
jgi:uncharacterized DUF497 family protein